MKRLKHTTLRKLRFWPLPLVLLLFFMACREEKIEPEQFGFLKGLVLDAQTNQPIENALISTSPSSSTLFSASDGSFFLGKMAVGALSVRAEKDKYDNDLKSVTISNGDTATVILQLSIDTINTDLPNVPLYLNPTNGAMDVTIPMTFRWRKSATNSVRYSLLVFEQGSSAADTLVSGLSDTVFVADDLALGSDFYWQLMVTDNQGQRSFGPVWQFSTQEPPNNRIVFARLENGIYSIYSCNELGQNVRRLTPSNYSAWRPRWNPQRTKIAFLSTKNGVDPDIFTINPDGSGLTQITSSVPVAGFSLLDVDFTWNPAGTQLLYMNQNRLYIVSASGSGSSVFAAAPQGFTFSEVDWSSATNKILARTTGQTINESEFLEYNTLGQMVDVVQIDEIGREGGPAISILGTTYLNTFDVSAFNAINGRQLDTHIFVSSIGGTGKVDLSYDKTPGTNDLDPRFSPTGAKILFTNRENDDQSPPDLYSMQSNGMDRELLVENAEMGDWK